MVSAQGGWEEEKFVLQKWPVFQTNSLDVDQYWTKFTGEKYKLLVEWKFWSTDQPTNQSFSESIFFA